MSLPASARLVTCAVAALGASIALPARTAAGSGGGPGEWPSLPGRVWVGASGTVFAAGGAEIRLRGVNLGGWQSFDGGLVGLDDGVPEGDRAADEGGFWKILEERFGAVEAYEIRVLYHSSWITRTDFARVKAAGFNFVRLPFWPGWFGDGVSSGRIDPRGWHFLDRAVDWGRELGLWVMVVIDGAPGCERRRGPAGGGECGRLFRDRREQDRAVAIWQAVARRYGNDPAVLGYDLINDPGGGSPGQIASLHDRLYQAVRKEDGRHVIIMEDGAHGVETMPAPGGFGWRNVAYSVHLHATEASGEAEGRSAMAALADWRAKQLELGVPLVVGEFGGGRPEWGIGLARERVRAFESYGWAWAPWTFKRIEMAEPPSLGGLYRNPRPWPRRIDVHRSSARAIRNWIETMDTAYLDLNLEYLAALLGEGGRNE